MAAIITAAELDDAVKPLKEEIASLKGEINELKKGSGCAERSSSGCAEPGPSDADIAAKFAAILSTSGLPCWLRELAARVDHLYAVLGTFEVTVGLHQSVSNETSSQPFLDVERYDGHVEARAWSEEYGWGNSKIYPVKKTIL